MKFKITEGFLYLSLNGHRADLGLCDTWWWQPEVGGGRWRSWMAVGGCRWSKMSPKMPIRSATLKQGMDCFEPPWSLMRWLWWLPMVVGVFGVVLGVRGWRSLVGNHHGKGQKTGQNYPCAAAKQGRCTGGVYRVEGL